MERRTAKSRSAKPRKPEPSRVARSTAASAGRVRADECEYSSSTDASTSCASGRRRSGARQGSTRPIRARRALTSKSLRPSGAALTPSSALERTSTSTSWTDSGPRVEGGNATRSATGSSADAVSARARAMSFPPSRLRSTASRQAAVSPQRPVGELRRRGTPRPARPGASAAARAGRPPSARHRSAGPAVAAAG